MAERREYELSDEEHTRLLAASQPVPYLVFGGREPASPYDRAMRMWSAVAAKHGLDVQSIRPSPRGPRFFTAEAPRG